VSLLLSFAVASCLSNPVLAVKPVVRKSFPPILAAEGFVVGYLKGKYWHACDEKFGKATPPQKFTAIKLGSIGGTLRSALEVNALGGTYLKSEKAIDYAWLANATPRIPRQVTKLAKTDSTCMNILQKMLDQKLPGATARIKRAVRVDLDGDGNQEYLIEGISRDDFWVFDATPADNDYSIVLVNYVKGRDRKSATLLFSTGERDTLCAVADIDGDGRMEIVTTGQGYEWNNASVFSFRKGKVEVILHNEDGV